MIPLPESYIGSVCEIKTVKNDLLTSGRIFKIEDDTLDIVGISGEGLMLIPYRTTVKVSIFNSKEGLQMLMGVAYTSTDVLLRLVHVETLQNFERRVFFRVNVQSEATIFPVLTGDGVPGDGAVLDLGEPVVVKLENLSLSGLLMASTRKFQMGERFEVEMKIFKDKLRILCEVCRPDLPDGEWNRYGCQYVDATQKQSDILCRDLFQLQRIEIQKRKAMA